LDTKTANNNVFAGNLILSVPKNALATASVIASAAVTGCRSKLDSLKNLLETPKSIPGIKAQVTYDHDWKKSFGFFITTVTTKSDISHHKNFCLVLKKMLMRGNSM
jgi:hypothetical protein